MTLSLYVDGPSTAYSSDLVSSDPMVEAADDDVPIIDLKEGQRLEVEADAVLDTVGSTPNIRVAWPSATDTSSRWRSLATRRVRGRRPEHSAWRHRRAGGRTRRRRRHQRRTRRDDEFDNDLRNRYPGKDVEVSDVPNAFVFHVETDGSFTSAELVRAQSRALTARPNSKRSSEDTIPDVPHHSDDRALIGRRIETGLKGHAVRRSASRDSQVWPTAQRSGRCPIGVRRFKSCSLHSVFSEGGRQ